MPIQWSGSGPELLLRLDRSRTEPLRSQLEEGIRAAIRSGRVDVGERLPSSRALATELGVSRGLVQECYGQLTAEGYLVSHVGSATRVASPATAPTREPTTARRVPEHADSPRRLIADFRSGVPDLGSFPRTDWAWATREALRSVANADLDYVDARGSSVLREVLAAYLRRVRAASADADALVVCTGFAQGLSVVVRALARAGVRRIALEDPGYGALDVSLAARGMVRAGVEVVPVPVDEQGIDVDALAAAGAQAVVVTPAHQSPTGVVLTAHRRQALVGWARDTSGFVIEDDYDSEFRYDRDPVGVLQGLDPDRVFTLGTVSKSLAPALRLGWLVCPPDLVDAVAEEKHIADRGTSGLDQLALAALMESGRFDRHLRRMRSVYSRRRVALVDALATYAPAVRLSGLAAGFHAVAHLPDTCVEPDVVLAALDRRVGLYPMREFRTVGQGSRPQLVMGFGNVGERAIRTGIETVADLMR